MRCSLCDYCEGEAGSIYHVSLVDPKSSRNRKVILDTLTNAPICTVCLEYTKQTSKMNKP